LSTRPANEQERLAAEFNQLLTANGLEKNYDRTHKSKFRENLLAFLGMTLDVFTRYYCSIDSLY
jgi:hypothetical protein